MPDICMCTDSECPQKDTCHRFKVKPHKYMQSYFVESPREEEKCEYYWEEE